MEIPKDAEKDLELLRKFGSFDVHDLLVDIQQHLQNKKVHYSGGLDIAESAMLRRVNEVLTES